MAARSLSTRVCRQCRRSEAELAQRRFASSLAGPADEQVQQHEQQSPETAATATASSPVASTSTDNTADATQLLSKLRFEIYQAKPVRQQVWVRLHQLYAVSPSFLGHPSILQSTIRILSGHSGIPKTARGSGRIIAIQEEAEALYARYRFISNRMLETGTWEQNNLVNPKKNDRIFLTWLKGIQELGYGPAAWRIWADFRGTTSVENPSPLTAPIAHSVLVATMQWLIEQRDRGLDTDSFNAQSTQVILLLLELFELEI